MYLDRTYIIYLLTLYVLYVDGNPVTPINLNVNQNVSFDGESVDALRPNRISRSEVYPRVCGKRSQDFYPPISTRESRIIDGVPVAIKAYPWQVSLKVKEGKESKQHCGGAIISNRLILTAAHCIDLLREDEYFITVGEEDTSVNRIDEEQIFEVEKHMIHPKYSKPNQGYDIALVKLRTAKGINFGDNAQPICLPSSEATYKPGTLCHVSGWGMQKFEDESSTSTVLKAAQVPLISSNVCNSAEVYGNELNSDSMICAGYLQGGTDACRGDSGGPLACKVGDQFQLLGLVSWGTGCGNINKPGVYTKTFHFMDWIQEQITKL